GRLAQGSFRRVQAYVPGGFSKPQVQRDDSPQGAAEVGAPFDVILGEAADPRTADDPQPGEDRRGSGFPHQVPEGPAQPLGQWNAKRVLGTIVDAPGEQLLGRSPQQNLAGPATDLPSVRKSEPEIDDTVIEERASGLQRGSHRHAVHLDEEAVGKRAPE